MSLPAHGLSTSPHALVVQSVVPSGWFHPAVELLRFSLAMTGVDLERHTCRTTVGFSGRANRSVVPRPSTQERGER